MLQYSFVCDMWLIVSTVAGVPIDVVGLVYKWHPIVMDLFRYSPTAVLCSTGIMFAATILQLFESEAASRVPVMRCFRLSIAC